MSSMPEDPGRNPEQTAAEASWIRPYLNSLDEQRRPLEARLQGILVQQSAAMVYAVPSPQMPTEQWVAAPGFPDYEVSSVGRVRFREGSRLLSPTPRGNTGDPNRMYLRVNLMREEDGQRVRRTMSVHTLVALAFKGPPPTPQHQCAHRNGQNLDNRSENLMWTTAKENTGHQEEHGTRITGEQSNLARLCSNAVFAIRNLHEHHGWTYGKIARLFDLDPPVATRIAKRQSRASDKPRRPYQP